MKNSTRILALILLGAGMFSNVLAQACDDYYKEGDCRMDRQRGYRVLSQSGGYHVDTKDTLELTVMFYGQKEYIFTFCTDKELYPIHYTIYDSETDVLLYDNRNDRYIESLEIGMDVTRNLTFRIHAMANLGGSGEVGDGSGCLGVLFQYKNYPGK